MTTIYTTYIYLDDVDPTLEDGAGYGKFFVKLMEPLPTKRHSSLYVSVHSMDIPIPNQAGSFIPRKLRVKCDTPSVAQDPDTYNNTLLQLYTGPNILALPGDFSLVSFRDSSSSGTSVQVLDSQMQYFVIYLTDTEDRLYIPPLPFDIVLKIELVRNLQAEHLEQLNKLVSGINLLLLHNHITNPLDDDPSEQAETNQTSAQIYGPLDAT